jgi:hypothetical protein
MDSEIEIAVYDFEGLANSLADVLNSISLKTFSHATQAKFQKAAPARRELQSRRTKVSAIFKLCVG